MRKAIIIVSVRLTLFSRRLMMRIDCQTASAASPTPTTQKMISIFDLSD